MGTVPSSLCTEAVQQREGLEGGGTQQSYSVGGGSWIDNTYYLHNTVFQVGSKYIYQRARKCKHIFAHKVVGSRLQHEGLPT